MDQKPPRPNLKHPRAEDDNDDLSNKPPAKRVRFPKGKKVKPEDVKVSVVKPVEEAPTDLADPRVAAKERAKRRLLETKRRNQMTAELFSDDSRGFGNDIMAAEVTYDNNENFDLDGVQVEPFNLSKEREEGYFDADGNYVEYVNETEIKDAWLDSVDIDPKYTGKIPVVTDNEEDEQDLSADNVGTMKRRIADLLEPGETVLKALRRLKGTSNRKEKMSPETKQKFDQLTEDSMKLMENGEYNVYHEEQEVFEREAEGYERLARAKGKVSSVLQELGDPEFSIGKGMSSEVADHVAPLPDSSAGPSNLDASTAGNPTSDADEFDMFAEDDEPAKSSDGNNLVTDPKSNGDNLPASNSVNADSGASESDYVYDETSGYYYSSSSGYYYDPSTGLYCSAASGQWYSFNEVTGTYEEVPSSES